MTEKQKILFCGDVEGKFDALFKRVETIMKKSGAFDMLLCVGNFFGINNTQFEPYRTGSKTVPIPTYILGPNKEDTSSLLCSEENYELCNNVFYLGKRGLFTDSKGLKIAYLSGIHDNNKQESYNYSEKDISELYDICVKGNPVFRGVDILLASQWPNGILTKTETSPNLLFQSDLPSWLIMKLKPRYIIGGLEGKYYERPPFRATNLGDHDTTLEIVSRFIGLARVANPDKEKWIYALSLTPLDQMKISELLQKSIDETECPFNFSELDSKIFKNKKNVVGTKQYFYDTNLQEEEPKHKKRKHQKIEFDQNKCWFCLASPSVEKHLIITVGEKSYLTLAKGPLVDEHFLICPIEHYQNSLGQPRDVLDEISMFKMALGKFYERNDHVPVFFERNYKTSHMQLQAIPIPKHATKDLKEIFMDEAEGHGLQLEVLESHSRLDQVLPAGVPYFIVELPNGVILFTKIQASMNFPINFGREVLASGPVLNLPNKLEWKDCIISKDEEESLVQRLRTDFEPFDFSL